MDAARLDAARQALQERDYATVLDSYGRLLDGDEGLAVIIDDLEQASSLHREPRLVRLLGDAYMRDGQLQNAIDSYRRALDLM